MEATLSFVSASHAARIIDIPAARFFNAVHAGRVKPDGKLSDGTMLFVKDRLGEVKQTLESENLKAA